MSDPWREPVRGGYPEPSAFALSGREQLQGMLEGRVPPPPLFHLTGMQLTEAGDGTAVFEMPLTEWLYAPQGAISIGPLVIPADAALACAIQTTLGAGTPFSTSELTLRLLAPGRAGTRLIARARVLQMRQTIGLAEASLSGDQDRLIAHGSTLCMMLSAPSPDGAPPPTAPSEARDTPARGEAPGPDPWQRPALGEILPQSIWERMSGLEVLQAQLAGELPAPPIHHLTGLTLIAAATSEAMFEMPAGEWLCAPPRGRVQGGATALLAEAALSAAIQTTVPAATALAPIDVKLNYLRPLAADGRPARARGRVLHLGRRLAVASSEVQDADGKAVALATGSAMLLPGRPASLGAFET
jgi:uncharacterized protein (TIGR00369 family)